MAKRVQFIRHATAAADLFQGLNGELTIDTTKKEVRVHDGATVGGIAQARADLNNVNAATTSVAGKMSASDKTKLDSVETGAEVNTVDSVHGRTGAVVGASGDYDANDITFTPAGNIEATTVQAAIEELEGDLETTIALKANAADAALTGDTTAENFSASGNLTASGPVVLGASELTIASGVVVATKSVHSIDTESDAASDDLDTVTLTNLADGGLLYLYAENASRVVTVKHGTGNIDLANDADFILDDAQKSIILQRRGSTLFELCRTPSNTVDILLTYTGTNSDAGPDFDLSAFTSLYDGFIIDLINVVNATDNISLLFTIDINGTEITANYASVFYGHKSSGSADTSASSAGSSVALTGATKIGSDTGEGFSGSIIIPAHTSPGAYLSGRFVSAFTDQTGVFIRGSGGFRTPNTGVLDGINISPEGGGNIETGLILVRGIKNA